MELRKVTCSIWRHVPAGTSVPNGFGSGSDMTAPEEPGLYTLYELADEDNCHQGWQWDREPDPEDLMEEVPEDLRPGEGEAYDVPRHDPEPLTEIQRQRAEELYRHIGICPDAIVEDMAHDFLEVREGSDGEAYLVYVDYAQVAAIRISDGAILDETDRQDADRSPAGRDWFDELFG